MCKAKYCQYCLYLYFQALLFIDAETNYRYFHFVSNFVSLAVLDFFLSSDTSVCSMMAFFQLENSDYVVVSVSFDFPSYSKQDALFHCIVYGYSHADWDIFVIIWEVFHGRISLNSASAAASEFCEWVQVRIDVYIPHQKCQVKPHLSPWFSAACAAAIVHRNHLFHLYQKDRSESKVKFRHASNGCRRVLKAAKLAYANKTNESITSQKPGSREFLGNF